MQHSFAVFKMSVLSGLSSFEKDVYKRIREASNNVSTAPEPGLEKIAIHFTDSYS